MAHVPEDIAALYEVHDTRHAAAILFSEFPAEFDEICAALRKFQLSEAHVKRAGGNESEIPKAFSKFLRPSWKEEKLTAKLVVDEKPVSVDTHKIDYCKGRVALDLEWNSKDQTFDRDLFAFRTFFDYNKISVGVLITRSNDLDPWFASLGSYEEGGKLKTYKAKYGASTTHMGKLLPRLNAGRQGGCPLLVFGITRQLIVP
jgi:CRISPR-associated protein Csd2